jgi:iron complex transport system ATP-binding protein
MSNRIIEITDFTFSLEGNTILKDISLAVEEGDYISIVGPNGAGKTTLLKCISRIYRGGNGDIRIAGRPLNAYRQRALSRLISYVPQAGGSIAPFSVYEFVMMGRYPYLSPFSSPDQSDKTAVRDALEVTGVSFFKDRFLSNLSGGERQKVYIAAAIAQGANVLLLDEPATFLDPKHEAEIHALLARINRERGVTIVTVTHDINSAVLTSRRVFALKDGMVAFTGPPEKLINNEILNKIYGMSFQFVKHPQVDKMLVVSEALS